MKAFSCFFKTFSKLLNYNKSVRVCRPVCVFNTLKGQRLSVLDNRCPLYRNQGNKKAFTALL